MFPNNLITNGLPKSINLQSVSHLILECYRDGILLEHTTVILKVVHYETGNFMPKQFFKVDTQN